MNVVQIVNYHRYGGGLDNHVNILINLLRKRGINVSVVARDSRLLGKGLKSKVHAFLSGIYSFSAMKEITHILQNYSMDVVHVHEVYPLISPWVLKACRKAGVPVVFTCHDYRLTCPVGFHFHNGRVCKKCMDGHEYWCVVNNCRGNIFESLAYAFRSVVARRCRLFEENVAVFITATQFVKHWLIEAGFCENKITVIPCVVDIQDLDLYQPGGEYVAYVGRISAEKGIDTLIAAAQQRELPVKVAGDYTGMPELVKMAPRHVQFVGQLSRSDLVGFLRNARFLVAPSVWPEAFGMVVAEAMGYGLPVIASRIGGLPEVVEEGVTGLLFEPGNAEDLAKKMTFLWENPQLCRQMGQAGREKKIHEYTEASYYNRLLAVYEEAIKNFEARNRETTLPNGSVNAK